MRNANNANAGTEEALAKIFHDVFGYSGRLCDYLGPAAVPGWDSVAHIALVEALELRFGIKLSTEEMVEMTDVGRIKQTLRDHDARG